MKRVLILLLTLVLITLFGCSEIKEIGDEIESAADMVTNISESIENSENTVEESSLELEDQRLVDYANEFDDRDSAQMLMDTAYVGWGFDFSAGKIETFEDADAMLETYSHLFENPDDVKFKPGKYIAITGDLTGTYKDDKPAVLSAFIYPISQGRKLWSHTIDMKVEYAEPLVDVGETKTLTGIYAVNEDTSDWVIIFGNGYYNGGYPKYIMIYEIEI